MGHWLHSWASHPCLPQNSESHPFHWDCLPRMVCSCLSQDVSPWKPLGKHASRQRQQIAAQWCLLEDGGGAHPAGCSSRPQSPGGLFPPGKTSRDPHSWEEQEGQATQPQGQVSLVPWPLLSCLQRLRLGLQAALPGHLNLPVPGGGGTRVQLAERIGTPYHGPFLELAVMR